MKNIVVIYKSNYGTTKRYAEWIAEELGAPIFEASRVKPSQLAEYDVVVYGGGLYANGIIGVKLVAGHPCKSLVVFTVGLADPENTDYSSILARNFTHELPSEMKMFHLRGGIDYGNLGFIHKCMMAMVRKSAKKSASKEGAGLSGEDRLFLETYGEKIDFTDRAAIRPIVEYVRAL